MPSKGEEEEEEEDGGGLGGGGLGGEDKSTQTLLDPHVMPARQCDALVHSTHAPKEELMCFPAGHVHCFTSQHLNVVFILQQLHPDPS